jgi:glycosyltransferase involved in cell wall biosynthesis
MFENNFVSVIIPVYNRTNELRNAINSVLVQTWQNFEILVIDDGSTLDIKIVCDSFKDNRIRFIRNNKHVNANVARNIGIKNAKGNFIAMLDSDDEYFPFHIQRRLEKMIELNCQGIFGSAIINGDYESSIKISRPLVMEESMLNYLLSDGFAPTSSHFYKSLASKSIRWDESLERHQDLDYTIRFAENYDFISDVEPTIMMNWKLNDRKNLNLDSCIEFINRNKDKILKPVFNSYHRDMFSMFKDHENKKYVKYFSKNSYKYIYFVSLSDFLYVHKKNTFFFSFFFVKFIFLNFKFLFKKTLFSLILFFKNQEYTFNK